MRAGRLAAFLDAMISQVAHAATPMIANAMRGIIILGKGFRHLRMSWLHIVNMPLIVPLSAI